MEIQEKLSELLEGTSFRTYSNCKSGEQFIEIARHNEEQYARIEAKGEQYQERIQNFVCLLLSEKLNPLAMEKFGNTSDASLRKLLSELLYNPEMTSEWKKNHKLALAALSNEGFNKDQIKIIGELFDAIPGIIINFLADFINRLKAVPMQEVWSITKVLVQMIKEASYADTQRNN